jgi:hypothetical protein
LRGAYGYFFHDDNEHLSVKIPVRELATAELSRRPKQSCIIIAEDDTL